MPIMNLEESKAWMKEVVGTCAYDLCGKPMYREERRKTIEGKEYHEGCANQIISDGIDEHPIISHGVRRHTLVQAMEITD
jgi:hypothetical protein